MSNTNLRRQLERVTKQEVDTHEKLLESLRSTFGHSIKFLASEAQSQPDDFICFEYALGLFESDEYLAIRNYEQHHRIRPLGADEKFVEYLLDDGILQERARANTRTGDIVVYFRGGTPTHAGVLAKSGRVRSKWGVGHLAEHELFEVPAIYGDHVKYFRAPEIQDCEDGFVEYARSCGREFCDEQPDEESPHNKDLQPD